MCWFHGLVWMLAVSMCWMRILRMLRMLYVDWRVLHVALILWLFRPRMLMRDWMSIWDWMSISWCLWMALRCWMHCLRCLVWMWMRSGMRRVLAGVSYSVLHVTSLMWDRFRAIWGMKVLRMLIRSMCNCRNDMWMNCYWMDLLNCHGVNRNRMSLLNEHGGQMHGVRDDNCLVGVHGNHWMLNNNSGRVLSWHVIRRVLPLTWDNDGRVLPVHLRSMWMLPGPVVQWVTMDRPWYIMAITMSQWP